MFVLATRALQAVLCVLVLFVYLLVSELLATSNAFLGNEGSLLLVLFGEVTVHRYFIEHGYLNGIATHAFLFPCGKGHFLCEFGCTCGISLACLGSTRGNLGQGFLNCMGIGGKVSIPYKMFFVLYGITYNCSRFFFGVIFDTLPFQGFCCFILGLLNNPANMKTVLLVFRFQSF